MNMKMNRKKLITSVAAVLSILLTVSIAMAVVPELNLVFEVKDIGKVTFSGKIHADKGLKCTECHPDPFPTKRSAAGTYKMEKMNKGESCGTCHNGTKAFKTSDSVNCTKCHKK